MSIQRWYFGKLVLLWAWGVVLCFLLVQIIMRTENALQGLLLIGAALLILVVLSVVTWKWFGGREQ